ncbi:MAG: PQQ-binding-like beta-propeller repeat protein, partial [Acidobacteriaceae bacterium]|nr:PQQ-binding-like beta-propeller repeat protein [Acidobacteriaceae bacterium]
MTCGILRRVIRALPRIWLLVLLVLSGYAAQDPNTSSTNRWRDWRVYGGAADNIRYSSLDQINRGNVSNLRVAWTFDTQDAFRDSEMECNPIVVDGVVYATSPKLRVFALDAATGKQLWVFDPNEGQSVGRKQRNRG